MGMTVDSKALAGWALGSSPSWGHLAEFCALRVCSSSVGEGESRWWSLFSDPLWGGHILPQAFLALPLRSTWSESR